MQLCSAGVLPAVGGHPFDFAQGRLCPPLGLAGRRRCTNHTSRKPPETEPFQKCKVL